MGLTSQQVERYARHLVLKEIGGTGQNALLKAKVAIIGAGGLGGPAGLYLAAAGVGTLTLIDDDHVDLSNLQRQIQFTHAHIGTAKTQAMAESLRGINPDINIELTPQRLNTENARTLISGHDIVLDGTDDFATRFAVNAACLHAHIPLVSGALGRFDGHVSVFENQDNGPCYRCLVPHIPPDAETCAQVGVIGALAGIIGSMMALEAVKYITGAGTTLSGKVWIFDGLTTQSRTVKLPHDPNCPACAKF